MTRSKKKLTTVIIVILIVISLTLFVVYALTSGFDAGYLLRTAQVESFSLIDGVPMTCTAQGNTLFLGSNLNIIGNNAQIESIQSLQFITTEDDKAVNEILSRSAIRCDKLPSTGQNLWYEGKITLKSFIVNQQGEKILVKQETKSVKLKQTNDRGFSGLADMRYDAELANSKINTDEIFNTVIVSEAVFDIDLVLRDVSGNEIKRQSVNYSPLVSSIKIVVVPDNYTGNTEKTIEIVSFTPTKVFDGENYNVKTEATLTLSNYLSDEGFPTSRLIDPDGETRALYKVSSNTSIQYFILSQQNGNTATFLFSAISASNSYDKLGTWVWQFTRDVDNSPIAITTQEVLESNVVADDPTDNQQGADTTTDDTVQEESGQTPPTEDVVFEDKEEEKQFHIEICPPFCGDATSSDDMIKVKDDSVSFGSPSDNLLIITGIVLFIVLLLVYVFTRKH